MAMPGKAAAGFTRAETCAASLGRRPSTVQTPCFLELALFTGRRRKLPANARSGYENRELRARKREGIAPW
jgi:hypothetical protein